MSEETKSTLQLLATEVNSAQKEFDHQLKEKDGFAADIADGVSNLWGVFQEKGNQAWRVRDDLKEYKQDFKKLNQAALKGQAEFESEFEKMFGVKYNQQAVENYKANPTPENYQKAFGTKRNIKERVENYNSSQDTGATVVKTTGKIAAGVAIGVATGGTGLVGVAAAAAATAATSAFIEEADKLKVGESLTSGDLKFREGTDHEQIAKDALWDGAAVFTGGVVGKVTGSVIKGATTTAKVARASANAVGDVTMGAVQEKAQTGEVSATGTLVNATLGSVGIAAESGALNKVGVMVKKCFGKSNAKTLKVANLTPAEVKASTINARPEEMLAGGGNGAKVGFWDKLKSKFTKAPANPIDPALKEKLERNYLSNVARTVEANPNSKISNRLNKALNNRKLVTELDANADMKNISQYVGDGDVCAVGKKVYVNDNGTAVELKISKEKLEELFPPLGTSTFYQAGSTMTCTIQAKLNTMLDTPVGRTKIYTMLEQDGNDIIVNLRGNRAPLRFKDGKPININYKDDNANLFSFETEPANGVEMLQQAVLIDRIREADKNFDLTDVTKFSKSDIIKQAQTRSADSSASVPLLGTKGTSWYRNLEKCFETYDPGSDILIGAWDIHARSIVGYDKTTKIVTYHDPYMPGVDLTATLESLEGAQFTIHKASDLRMKNVAGSSYKLSTTTQTVGTDTYVPIKASINEKGKVSITKNGTPIKIDEAKVNTPEGQLIASKDGIDVFLKKDNNGNYEVVHRNSKNSAQNDVATETTTSTKNVETPKPKVAEETVSIKKTETQKPTTQKEVVSINKAETQKTRVKEETTQKFEQTTNLTENKVGTTVGLRNNSRTVIGYDKNGNKIEAYMHDDLVEIIRDGQTEIYNLNNNGRFRSFNIDSNNGVTIKLKPNGIGGFEVVHTEAGASTTKTTQTTSTASITENKVGTTVGLRNNSRTVIGYDSNGNKIEAYMHNGQVEILRDGQETKIYDLNKFNSGMVRSFSIDSNNGVAIKLKPDGKGGFEVVHTEAGASTTKTTQTTSTTSITENKVGTTVGLKNNSRTVIGYDSNGNKIEAYMHNGQVEIIRDGQETKIYDLNKFNSGMVRSFSIDSNNGVAIKLKPDGKGGFEVVHTEAQNKNKNKKVYNI